MRPEHGDETLWSLRAEAQSTVAHLPLLSDGVTGPAYPTKSEDHHITSTVPD